MMDRPRPRLACLALAALLAFAAGGFTPTAAAQEPYTIRGQVVDAGTMRPLAGAQISIQGTQIGTITGQNGNFLLIASLSPGDYTLNATFLGRESASRRIQLGATRAVEVAQIALAERALELDEIIVTGTAAPTSRRAIGNAVATVDTRQLQDTPATTIDQALQGKVAGALITSNTGTPGGGVSVRLRGTSSIIAGAEPLYIVDGVIVDNNADQQINVGYRSNPINRLADLNPDDIERIEILKGAAAAALYGSRANNGVVQIFTRRGRAGEMRMTASTRLSRGDLPTRLPFALTPVNLQGQAVQRFDHQDLIFRDAYGQDSHVSLSGGAADTRYYLSASYTDQQGIMIGSAHNKLNARMNVDQGFGQRFSISAGVNYVLSSNDLVVSGEQGEGGLLTAIVFTGTDVNLAGRDPETGDYLIQQTTFPNPLVVVRDWSLPQTVSRFVGSFQARANPLTDMTLEYRLGYDTYNMETRQTIPRGAYLADGRATSANRGNQLINNDIVGSYIFSPIGDLRLTASGGVNHTFQRVEQLNASARDLVPFTELVRGAVQFASQSRTELVTLGYMTQLQSAWADRLFLTGALRWDASSTFGTDERWQMYPKVSASYVLSDEPFFRNSPAANLLGELRLRAALGYAGNQPPLGQAYARVPRYGTAINIDRLGLVPLAAGGNPLLRPERQREVEGGFDIASANERVGLTFTYYDQLTDDLLLSRVFPASTGVSSVLDNVGQLSNRGVEVELNTTNLQRDNFRWNTTVIYSRNRNRVERLVGDPFTVGYTNRVQEGHALGVHRMNAFSRDAQGNILYDAQGLPILHRNAAGAIEPLIVGDPWPGWTGSMRNEFRLGQNWSASFLLDGQFGHQLWNQTQRIMDIFNAGPLFDAVLRGEITPAERTRLQSIWEYYLEDASFVKLRDVAVRYSVPNQLARRIGADAMSLELMGRNLHTWTGYSGYDPEINMFGLSTVERGTDFAVYPNAREIVFGVRVNF
jgi:TonB-dependent starch-binding outer membrane protein SusC